MKYQYRDLFGIDGKVIVVSGGTRGIGRELSLAFSDLGASVAVIGTNKERLNEVEIIIKEKGADFLGVIADVSDETAVDHAFDEIIKKFRKIDGLINCAGINHIEELDTIPMEKFQRVMDVNFSGTVLCCRAAGKYMLKSGYGRIVNISSLSAFKGKSKYTAYSASKSAIHGFTRALSTEWAKKNINVNVISPGLIVTDINREMLMENPKSYKQRIDSIPRGCPGKLEWIVSPVVMLLSEGSSHITGQVICVDGGISTGDTYVLDDKK